MTKLKSPIAATIPESLARAPLETLISDCPIMAHPPIPENIPDKVFATPCAKASLFAEPLVSVISSTILRVSRLSISPTPAIMSE